ncbi:hypothetical protein I3271_06485 [Photobacterium leiognathi]|uniref:hypothetical protein n=1 Tax=Photobacterium leiognathi TaxID=553611 RepID=UPI001EDEA71A|nr:hypothetical protein [Photobacterium leiognathi]MCG3884331.1 hypothetical protein [Photobacterium leiognathi]
MNIVKSVDNFHRVALLMLANGNVSTYLLMLDHLKSATFLYKNDVVHELVSVSPSEVDSLEKLDAVCHELRKKTDIYSGLDIVSDLRKSWRFCKIVESYNKEVIYFKRLKRIDLLIGKIITINFNL